MWRGMSCRLHLHSLRGTIIRFALLLSAFLCITQAGYAVDVSFDKDVLPIMQAKCFRCHNQQRAEGSLRLDLKASVLQGGDSGPALIASNAEDSLILHRIQASDASIRMPLDAARLSAQEIKTLRSWIDLGAPGLRDVDQTDHWAFIKISRPGLPNVQNPDWAQNAIDRFVLSMAERQGVMPAPAASRRTLIRRLTFDLLGVPPSMEEVSAFESADGSNAYEQLVERLLSDPRFGERWGRHWLDLARYADSSGYEADRPRKIWHYRDWVIDALNQDQPVSEFVIEQFGGDLLPQPTDESRVATGFHCNAMLDPGVRHEAVLDRVNVTGSVFLGLTLGCAQCHDHKTDPVTQKEYYQLYAFFNGASAYPLDLSSEELKEQRQKLNDQITEINQQITAIDQQIKDELNRLVEQQVQDLSGVAEGVVKLLQIPADQRGEPEIAQLEAFFQGQNEDRKQLVSKQGDLQKSMPEADTSLVFAQDNRATHLFVRGDHRQPGEKVVTAGPAFLPLLEWDSQTHERPTRLDLGRWIVSDENPLFARVTVNRIWMRLMGNAIVESENDFGVQTARPSHFALLDYLASTLQEEDSFKQLIREIVLSATYQQSSHYQYLQADKEGLFLSQRRLRLEVETLRDNALSVAGLLERQIGGPSVFPAQPDGILDFRATPATWVESTGANRYRRGMYTYIWRLTPHPMMTLFDGPEMTTACTRRNRSNIAVQSLALLNDPVFVESAQALARRIVESAPTPQQRIEALFHFTLNRQPKEQEVSVIEGLLRHQTELFSKDTALAQLAIGKYPVTTENLITHPEHAAWVAVCRTMMNLDEFIMRE